MRHGESCSTDIINVYRLNHSVVRGVDKPVVFDIDEQTEIVTKSCSIVLLIHLKTRFIFP